MKLNDYSFLWVCLFLVLGFWAQPVSAETVDRIVAKVGTDVITLSDVSHAISEQRQYLKDTQGGKNTDTELARFKANIVEELILQKILEAEIKREKISVGLMEVDSEFKARLRQFGFTEEQMRSKLSADGLSVQDYKDSLRKQLEKRSFIQKKIAPHIDVSDFDVQKEYQANISKFQQWRQVRFMEVVLMKTKFASDEELKKVAMDIMARLKSGNGAAELIKKYSDGAFAASGGDSGVVETSTLRTEIVDVLNSLKPGEVSPALATSTGIFMFKLVSHASPEPMPYNKVSGMLRGQVVDRTVEKALRKYLLGVRETTYVEVVK
jgi:peptidyl-prolyl cis-trans isomerase SurA